jgi:Skp family chaperone for outer membrane proteins
MKTIRLFAVAMFLTALFALAAVAQTGGATASPNTGKIAVIVTYAFGDEKQGITKYINAEKALNTEFTPIDNEIKAMNTKLEALATEIENLRKLAASNPKAVDEKTAQAKVDEAERLQRDLKFKADNAKINFEKREQAVMGPIMEDIGKALQEFTKKNGYLMLLDAGKLQQAGILLGVGDEKIDVTKDFITFYNSRPAGTAATTTTPPKNN